VSVKTDLENQIFLQPLDEIWRQVKTYFNAAAPKEIAKANDNPKHKMALIFRWYLGKSSRWPIEGVEKRRVDYQVWCGPAMASFNDWVQGTILEPIEKRHVVQIARNLLEGATHMTRSHQLRSFGIPVPASAFNYQAQWL
jgi:PfaD family protein